MDRTRRRSNEDEDEDRRGGPDRKEEMRTEVEKKTKTQIKYVYRTQ